MMIKTSERERGERERKWERGVDQNDGGAFLNVCRAREDNEAADGR